MITWHPRYTPYLHAEGDFQDHELLDRVLREFPIPTWSGWGAFDNANERKKWSEVWQGKATRSLADMLQDHLMLATVAEMFNIGGQLSGSFVGGGYHLIEPGGYLGRHVDFNQLDNGLFRRANILVYLNRGWTYDQGGCLELSSPDGHAGMVYTPEFGRVIAFPTSESSWHGHPVPTKRARRSFAMYVYSDQPPSNFVESHSTIFQ